MKKKLFHAFALVGSMALFSVFPTQESEAAEDVLSHRICYSESKVRTGWTYYDCGACSVKVIDEKGKGSYTKCFL